MIATSIAAKPYIICLCGSTRFREVYRREMCRLTFEGNIVLTVGCLKGDPEWGQAPKLLLDVLHKRKIDLADEVFVLNVNGYVGESTASEIQYAESIGKAVRYLEM